MRFNLFLALVGVTLFNWPGFCQTSPTETQSPKDALRNECRQHCIESLQSIDSLTNIVREARQSEDTEKMKGSLDDTQRVLMLIRQHLASCIQNLSAAEELDHMRDHLKP